MLQTAGQKLRSFRPWAYADCAALPIANAGQYATSHYKPLLFWCRYKRRYINVRTLNPYTQSEESVRRDKIGTQMYT